jgi:hypothetical protein
MAMKPTTWIIVALLAAVGILIWLYRGAIKSPSVVHTIHSVVNPSAAKTIDSLQVRLSKSDTRYDSSQKVIGRLRTALSRISLKTASPAALDSLRTVLVPPGPKTDTTYCIDLAEARDLYEIKAREPVKDAMITEYKASAEALHADLAAVQVGIDSLERLNNKKDSLTRGLEGDVADLKDKLDRPFSVGPHAGWDIRNQPTIGISVQYSLFRFRLWKKKK